MGALRVQLGGFAVNFAIPEAPAVDETVLRAVRAKQLRAAEEAQRIDDLRMLDWSA